jgi:hypothetical protein
MDFAALVFRFGISLPNTGLSNTSEALESAKRLPVFGPKLLAPLTATDEATLNIRIYGVYVEPTTRLERVIC